MNALRVAGVSEDDARAWMQGYLRPSAKKVCRPELDIVMYPWIKHYGGNLMSEHIDKLQSTRERLVVLRHMATLYAKFGAGTVSVAQSPKMIHELSGLPLDVVNELLDLPTRVWACAEHSKREDEVIELQKTLNVEESWTVTDLLLRELGM